MNEPSVSVVIPVRNGMPYLPAAVQSALRDLPANGELIIRNNFSTDGTAEWLAGVDDPRVRVIESDVSVGAGENWTAVCREATGEYVKLLCADDFLIAGGLRRQLKAARAPGVVMVASRRQVVDDSGDPVMRSHGLAGLVGRRGGRSALARSIASGTNAFGEPSAVLIRRDALHGALPFTSEFPYLTDLDLYARVLTSGDFVGLETVDAAFRISPTSWSTELGNAQLREFRSWMSARSADGSLQLTVTERLRAAIMIPAKFVARRVVNESLNRRARKRTAAR